MDDVILGKVLVLVDLWPEPIGIRNVAQRLGIEPHQARAALNQLGEMGKIVRPESGRGWVIA